MFASIDNLLKGRLFLEFVKIFVIFGLFWAIQLTDYYLLRINSPGIGQILIQSGKPSGSEIIICWPVNYQFPTLAYFILSFTHQVHKLLVLLISCFILRVIMRAADLKHPIFGVVVFVEFWFYELWFAFPSFSIQALCLSKVICLGSGQPIK